MDRFSFSSLTQFFFSRLLSSVVYNVCIHMICRWKEKKKNLCNKINKSQIAARNICLRIKMYKLWNARIDKQMVKTWHFSQLFTFANFSVDLVYEFVNCNMAIQKKKKQQNYFIDHKTDFGFSFYLTGNKCFELYALWHIHIEINIDVLFYF